jgi:hypothetical protein
MRYHIYKATRLYEGRPYAGPASDGQPAEVDKLCEAVILRDIMFTRNPVGWRIHDTATGQDVVST